MTGTWCFKKVVVHDALFGQERKLVLAFSYDNYSTLKRCRLNFLVVAVVAVGAMVVAASTIAAAAASSATHIREHALSEEGAKINAWDSSAKARGGENKVDRGNKRVDVPEMSAPLTACRTSTTADFSSTLLSHGQLGTVCGGKRRARTKYCERLNEYSAQCLPLRQQY